MDIQHTTQNNIQRVRPSPRWSDATVFNGIVHFVEVATDTEQNISNQTAQILAQADTTLAAVS